SLTQSTKASSHFTTRSQLKEFLTAQATADKVDKHLSSNDPFTFGSVVHCKSGGGNPIRETRYGGTAGGWGQRERLEKEHIVIDNNNAVSVGLGSMNASTVSGGSADPTFAISLEYDPAPVFEPQRMFADNPFNPTVAVPTNADGSITTV